MIRYLRADCGRYVSIVMLNGLISEWDDGYWLMFFTNLSYIGIFIYLWVQSICFDNDIDFRLRCT